MMLPLIYMGEGEFRVRSGFIPRADKLLTIGEQLHWEQINQRSLESHKHFFSCVADAWNNLPEAWATTLPSPEHLRKHALVMAGYCDTVQVVCATNTDAVKACSQFKAMDSYSVCSINDRVVTVSTAHSQSMKAMGGKVFQASKERVLQVISEMIGADATELGKAA